MSDCSILQTPLKEKLSTFFDESKDLEIRLKAAQDFSDAFEYTSQNTDYPDILKELYERSQRFLMQTESQFLQENPLQQLRKQCLELFQKVPNSNHNTPYWKNFMNNLMKLVEYENEENTMICVKLLVDIHKSQRPNFSNEVLNFLKFVRSVYKELQNHTNKIFTHTSFYEVDTIDDFPLDTKILETFTCTKIITQQRDANDNRIEYNILPKSCYSLKVMQEIPVLLVLMYQFHKSYITNEIASFIPLIMDFLNLIPTELQKKDILFNETLYLDFLAAQVKTLSFLAYVVKFFKKALMEKHADSLVQGMYKMIVNIPSNVTNMRKEYFIAARHILGTQEIKPRFIMVLSDLMNEDVLIGDGYTVNQLLRPLAYSTLADLIHFVKSELNLAMIAKATNMYIKNMHDDTLVFSIQQMSMKLLLNFIEPIKNRSVANLQEAHEGRQLLIKILYALIKRLGTISKFYLPKLEKDCLVELIEKPSNETDTKLKVEETVMNFNDKLTMPSLPKIEEKPIKPEHTLILPPLSLQDLKTLTKHLIHGIKTITLTLTSKSTQLASSTPLTSRQASDSSNIDPQIAFYKDKVLDGFDVKIYCKLIRYCIRMMDLYLIYNKDGQFYQRPPNTPMNSKFTDEKSILESIAIIFLHLSPANFKEIFQTQIKYVIDRTNINGCIVQLFQIILSSSQEEQPANSAILANLILTYLLENMEIIGEATPEANLHIKLFKLIFNSVHANLASFENVLEIHLKRIVLGCMKYSLSAKDPSSFMCLLRYLFRSIGGGAHERLYREFLPLLPLMLTGLSSLLRSPHTNQVRDLLGELCVIVPVRLSTLLPHLSLLMEPLVHVLSCNTISQGLRTLELCVDNMSPEYLYQNMYPVRGDIMFAMLQSFRCKNEQVNRTAFKVLGKMGKYNRCDLLESQQIRLDNWKHETGPELKIRFIEFPEDSIYLPWKDIISSSVELLKSEKIDQQNKEKIERVNKAWKVLKTFVVKVIDGLESVSAIESMDQSMFHQMPFNCPLDIEVGECQWIGYNSTISESNGRFSDNPIVSEVNKSANFIDSLIDSPSELKEYELAKTAIAGLLIGCLHEDIRKNNFDFIVFLIEQLTLASLVEQSSFDSLASDNSAPKNMFFSATRLLVDSISETMAYEDKDAIRIGTICLEKVCALSELALGSKWMATRLFIFNLFAHRIIQQLHKPAWYCKWGACATFTMLMRTLHPWWLWGNLLDFMKGFFYAINDLNLQICQGALSMTKDCLEILIEVSMGENSLRAMKETVSCQEDREKLQINYEKLVASVCLQAISTLLSENDAVREKAAAVLRQLSKITNRTLNALLQPHLHVFSDILPPSPAMFHSYPVSKQIAVLETNYFFGNHTNCGNCVHYGMEIESQEKFVSEVRNILETSNSEDDAPVTSSNLNSASTSATSGISSINIINTPNKNNLGCNNSNQQHCTVRQACAYTDMSITVALKVAACKLLSTLWYLDTEKDRNFQALFKAMCSKDTGVHETAFKCLQEFLSHTTVSLELRNANLKPLLTTFRENYSITTNRQLYYCARLFHASFSERMCESLLISKVKPLLDLLYEKFDKNGYIDTENDEKFTLLIKTVELFHVLQAASNKYVQTLTELVLKVEQKIFSCTTSQLRRPLILYLAKCPVETVKLFLQNPSFIDNFYANNFFIDCLDFKEAKPIRDHLHIQIDLLIDLLGSKSFVEAEPYIEKVVKKDLCDDIPANMISFNVQHFIIKIIHRLAKSSPLWWLNSKRLIDAVNNYWCSNDFKNRLTRIDRIHYSHWKDVEIILFLLTRVVDHYPESYQYLFSIARAFKIRALGSLHKLRDYLTVLFETSSELWKQKLFRYYVEQATNKMLTPDILYVIFAHIVLPAFCISLEKINGQVEQMDLLGGPPRPNEDADDIVTVFLNQLIENQEGIDGGLRVAYYQFCILILEYAPSYIHEISNRKKGHKARIIMTFAWPSVTNLPHFTDLLEKYVGLQTIAYLISKFNINRKIIVKVFTCLAKGNSVEPKKVVNAALGVLVSAWLQRKDDLNFLVLHTKKASRDDVTSQSQLHIGNLIVRHADIYYQAKLHMIPLMQHFIIRLSNQNFQPDQRRCLLDMIELLLRWDIRGKEEPNIACSSTIQLEKPLFDLQKETLANLIVRLMVQILDQSQTNSALVETSCRRALLLLETALHPMVWGPINLNIEPMARYFKLELNVTAPIINPQMQTQFNNMFMCLDLLTTLIKLMEENNILQNMKLFSKPLCDILNNPKVAQGRFIKYFGMVMKALLLRFPAEASNKQKLTQCSELLDLYNAVLKVIQDAFMSYEQKPSTPNSARVQSALYLLNMTQQVKINTYAFVDRCLLHLVNMGHKLVSEIVKPGNNQNEEVEQLIGVIDIIKSRFNVLGADLRRNKVINIFFDSITNAKDAKLLRVVISTLRNWMKLPKQEEHFAPSIREKFELFVRLWARYPLSSDYPDVQKEILSVLLLVFENEQIQTEDAKNSFQTAFCCGMVSPSIEVREKYLEFFLEGIRNVSLLEKFLFLISANDWDNKNFKLVNWIPTFLEVLLMDVKLDDDLLNISLSQKSKTVCKVEEHQAMDFESFLGVGILDDGIANLSMTSNESPLHALIESKIGSGSDRSYKVSIYNYFNSKNVPQETPNCYQDFGAVLSSNKNFWSTIKNIHVGDVVPSILLLSYHSSNFSNVLFQQFFPQLWAILSQRYPDMWPLLKQEMVHFLSSPSHNQHIGQSTPNPMSFFIEAIARIPNLLSWLHDSIFMFLTSSHNQWFLGTMMMEDCLYRMEQQDKFVYVGSYKFPGHDTLPRLTNDGIESNGILRYPDFFLSLNSLYEILEEDDYQFGLWSESCSLLTCEMQQSIAAAQQGHYDKALKISVETESQFTSSNDNRELVLRKKFYDFNFRYLKKLGQWDTLDKYLNEENINYLVKVESLWRKGQWKDIIQHHKLTQISVPESDKWRSQLIYCYALIMNRISFSHEEDSTNTPQADSEFPKVTALVLQQWKSLPDNGIICPRHVTMLQACNLAVEGWDGMTLFASFPISNVLSEVKSMVKSWKNRLPHSSDSFSFWSDIVLWRKAVFDKLTQITSNAANDSSRAYRNEVYMLLLELVRNSRKQHLPSANKYYADKMKQQLTETVSNSFALHKQECKMKMLEEGWRHSYVETLEMLENTDAQKFKDRKDLAKFFCYKAMLFSYFNKGDEATRHFGYALQIDAYNNKIWSIYADFLENVFSNYPAERRQKASHTTGIFAITALVEAASTIRGATGVTNSNHARDDRVCSNLAKCLWLVTLDDNQLLMARHWEEISNKLPPSVLLPWARSLVTCILRPEGKHVVSMLLRLANEYPEAVYVPLRCLRDKLMHEDISLESDRSNFTEALKICENLINQISKNNGPKLHMIDEFCYQLEWLSPSWSEQLLAQLFSITKQLEDHIYSSLVSTNAFSLLEAPLPDNFVTELQHLGLLLDISTDSSMDIDNEDPCSVINRLWSTWLSLTNNDVVSSRYHAFLNSRYFQDIRVKFSNDFGNPNSLDIMSTVNKLKKVWIPLMKRIVNLQPKSHYLDEKTRLLTEIAQSSCELSLPGDLSLIKRKEHRLHIASVCPLIERVWNNHVFSRKIKIRASNGHNFEYYIQPSIISLKSLSSDSKNDGCSIYRFWMQERFFQMIRVINESLNKERETNKNGLRLHAPRLMEINCRGIHLREVGCGMNPILRKDMDNEDHYIVSLEDIWFWYCNKKINELEISEKSYSNILPHLWDDKEIDQNKSTKEILRDTKKSYISFLNDVKSHSFVETSGLPASNKKRETECFQLIKEHTGNQALVKFARAFCSGPEDYWMLRKRITNDIATFSMVQWLLKMSCLGPQQYIFDLHKVTLQICTPELELFESGDLPLPFRLSPNIVQFIQPSGDSESLWKSSSQPFTSSMIATGHSLYWCRSNLAPLIRALIRDYMIFYDKTMRYNSPETTMDNSALEKWLSAASDQICKKINAVGTSDDDSVVKDQIQKSLGSKEQAATLLSYQSWI